MLRIGLTNEIEFRPLKKSRIFGRRNMGSTG